MRPSRVKGRSHDSPHHKDSRVLPKCHWIFRVVVFAALTLTHQPPMDRISQSFPASVTGGPVRTGICVGTCESVATTRIEHATPTRNRVIIPASSPSYQRCTGLHYRGRHQAG